MSDFNLFPVLTAIDSKSYGYLASLPIEEQRKFAPYTMMIWLSSVTGNQDTQEYQVRGYNHINDLMFSSTIGRHPTLQWQLLCSASLGTMLKHQWIPQLSTKYTKFREKIKHKDAKEYFNKIGETSATHIADYVTTQNKCHYLAKVCPNMKLSDLYELSTYVTQDDITDHQASSGM